jgi:hypothetical protein
MAPWRSSGGNRFVRKLLPHLGFSCAPNARSGLGSGEPGIVASRNVGSCHIQSHVSSPDCRSSIPFGGLTPHRYIPAMTARARARQSDIARALREAQKIGAKRVKIGADGSIDIVLETEEQAAALPNGRHDEPLGPIRIRDRPKKKVVL